jgi:hypothetical protein
MTLPRPNRINTSGTRLAPDKRRHGRVQEQISPRPQEREGRWERHHRIGNYETPNESRQQSRVGARARRPDGAQEDKNSRVGVSAPIPWIIQIAQDVADPYSINGGSGIEPMWRSVSMWAKESPACNGTDREDVRAQQGRESGRPHTPECCRSPRVRLSTMR